MAIMPGTIVKPFIDIFGGTKYEFPCESVKEGNPDVCVGIVRGIINSHIPDNPRVAVDWVQQCGFHKRELVPTRRSMHDLDSLWEIGQTR